MFLFQYVFTFLWFTFELDFVIYSLSRTKTPVMAISLIGLFSVFRRPHSAASLVAEVHEVHIAC